ncbi:hypothetical protein AVEN_207433-1, partial [Araneus ventricosus]
KSDHSEAEDYEEEDHEDETEHHEDHYELINSLFNNYDQSSSPTHGTSEEFRFNTILISKKCIGRLYVL